MAVIYAWPPVAATARLWTTDIPVSVSENFFDGAVRASGALPVRREAFLSVSGIGCDEMAAGWLENLRILLAGGENYVRLYSGPVNWRQSAAHDGFVRRADVVDLLDEGVDVDLTDDGTAVTIYDGRVLNAVATTDAGFPAISVTGFPPNRLVARPSEFITYQPDSAAPVTVRVLAAAVSDGTGAATIRLMSAVAGAGRINVGVRDTGVFRCTSFPKVPQPDFGDWSIDMQFVEVLPDEYGAASEVDPWR